MSDSGYWVGGMMCNQLVNTKFDYSILAGSFSPSYLGLVKMCHILGCLEGVWEVSGGCLSDSGYCLGGYDVNSIDEHKIWIILISCIIFSQWSFLGDCWPKEQNFRSEKEG